MNKTRPIKIIHVIHSFGIGGMENGLVNIINKTQGCNFTHQICCISKNGPSVDKLTHPVQIFEMNKGEGNSLLTMYKMYKLIKRERPDIVHTRNWSGVDGIIAALLARVPYIIHGEHGWGLDDVLGRSWKRKIVRKLLSKFVDKFVTVSADIKQWLITGSKIPSDKIVTIINGVDTDKFSPQVDNSSLRKTLGVQKGDVVLGMIARMDPIKRHDFLFQIFDKLNHEKFQLKLIVAGTGPEENNLKKLHQNLNHKNKVLLLGERNDTNRLYTLFDIFILTSSNEGISNTILEAMASGVPVVAANVGGNPELVSDKKTGFLVKPNSLDDFQEKINMYLENVDIRKEHAINARVEVEKRFNLGKMINDYEQLYIDFAKN